MLTTREVIERLKSVTDTGSYYAVSKILGISDSTVSLYVKGRRIMADDVALKAAEILHIQPEFILASLAAERAKDSPAALHWAHIADTLTPKNWRDSAN